MHLERFGFLLFLKFTENAKNFKSKFPNLALRATVLRGSFEANMRSKILIVFIRKSGKCPTLLLQG